MDGHGDQAQFELGETFDLPPFSPTDADAAEQLAAEIADQPSGSLLLALPREESVLRRLELPTTEPDELPTVARFRLLMSSLTFSRSSSSAFVHNVAGASRAAGRPGHRGSG